MIDLWDWNLKGGLRKPTIPGGSAKKKLRKSLESWRIPLVVQSHPEEARCFLFKFPIVALQKWHFRASCKEKSGPPHLLLLRKLNCLIKLWCQKDRDHKLWISFPVESPRQKAEWSTEITSAGTVKIIELKTSLRNIFLKFCYLYYYSSYLGYSKINHLWFASYFSLQILCKILLWVLTAAPM